MDLPNDAQTIGRIVLAAVPAIVTIVGLTRGPGAFRAHLRHDLELLEKMPADSAARTTFEAYLNTQVERFTKLETDGTRDVSGLIIAGMLVIGLGALTLWLFTLEHWWWYPLAVAVGVFAVAGLAYMYDAAQKVPRDKDGKRL